jgi:anti-sigma factor RsiW
MTEEIDTQQHPSEEALAAWVDARIGADSELVEMARSVTPHLADCPACRARVQELESVVALVRARPAIPTADAFALRKARVLEAIERNASVQPMRSRAWWWVPAVAAAALVALLIGLPEGDERVPSGIVDRSAADRTAPAESTAPATEESLPVVAAASAAADELATMIEDADDAEEGAAVFDPVEEPASESLGDVTLVDEFASLSPADQQVILDELAAMEFEL